jgi:hypothetical protein
MADTFAPKLASATSAAPAGATAAFSLAGECPQVRFLWKPTTAGDRCQVRWGKGAQTAVTTDMQLSDAGPEAFTKQDATDGAVIGTGTLYIICGHGE